MAGVGGYQAPTNPAVVSGPGSLSKRTDGSPSQPATYISRLPYGQGEATYNQQTAAPMAEVTEVPQRPLKPIVGLNEPTQFKDEPISFGADWGAGPGLSSVVSQAPSLLQTVEKAMQYDNSGVMEFLYNKLNK
jgi:hypothetical protein